jgi:hypothetical protein
LKRLPCRINMGCCCCMCAAAANATVHCHRVLLLSTSDTAQNCSTPHLGRTRMPLPLVHTVQPACAEHPSQPDSSRVKHSVCQGQQSTTGSRCAQQKGQAITHHSQLPCSFGLISPQ